MTLPADLGIHTGRQGIDHRDANAVQTARDRVSTASEFATGVQDRHDDLDGGLVLGRVLVDGDAPAVVDDPQTAVGQNGDFDVVAETRKGLIHGVVDNLVHQVVEAPLTGGADIHSGPLTDGFEPFEDGDVGSTVAGGSPADLTGGLTTDVLTGNSTGNGRTGSHRLVLVRHVSAAPRSMRRAAPTLLDADWRARSRGV